MRETLNKIYNLPISDKITDYDLRSLVNLYGIDGINYEPPPIERLPDPISPDMPTLPVFIAIIIVVLAAIVYFAKKRRGKSSMYVSGGKRSSSKVPTKTSVETTLDDESINHSKSKKCPYCGRRLQNYDKPRPCSNCGNMV